MPHKLLSSEYISKHIYFTARKDRYEMESGKIVDPYFVVELPPSACALALTEDNKVLFVRQYRHPLNEMLMELPGGFIDAGEDPKAAIERELLEETGYAFDAVHYLGNTAANPGVLNNYTYLFLVTGGKKVQQQQLDANEEITIILRSLDEAKQMLERNEVKQSMHALCMFYAFEFLANKKG